jgi:BolA protein
MRADARLGNGAGGCDARAMPNRSERIRTSLEAGLAPVEIEVRDDSALHAGHAGARPGGETHYHVRVVSAAFTGLNRVARTRLVHAALAAEFASGLHALALTLRTPGEE